MSVTREVSNMMQIVIKRNEILSIGFFLVVSFVMGVYAWESSFHF